MELLNVREEPKKSKLKLGHDGELLEFCKSAEQLLINEV